MAWIGFYAMGVGLAAALFSVPYAQVSYGKGPDLGGIIAGIGAVYLLWGFRPHFGPRPAKESESDEEVFPELRALVDGVAGRIGHPAPRHVKLLLDANAYAAYRSSWFGRGRSIVGIGIPYLAWLDRTGVEAIIAHEMGHHVAGDVKFGPWVHRTRYQIARTLDHLEGSSFWLDLPFQAYARMFLRQSLVISRAQELEADAVSVRVAGAAATGRALRVAAERGALWDVYVQTEVLPMVERGFLPDLLAGFRIFEQAFRTRVGGLAPPSKKTSVYDTHPSLSERLDAIGLERRQDTGESADLTDSSALMPALVGKAAAAEEHALRSILVNPARKLEPLAWEDAGKRVWLALYRDNLAPYRKSLAALSLEDFPRAIASLDAWLPHLRGGLALLSPEAERRRALGIFGSLLALLLDARGFTIEALPGSPVRLRRGDLLVDPFERVRSLAEGRIPAQDWGRFSEGFDGAGAAAPQPSR